MTAASSASFDADGHPEVAEISALTEGILPPARSARVRSHLSDCVVCSEVRTSLEEVRDALGTLPGPVRMPEDVAGRIDAALAAEALLDATLPADGPRAAPRQAPAGPPASGARDVSRETSATPGRGTVSRETAVGGRPPGRPHGPIGPGRSGRRSGRRRAAWLGAATAASLALGTLVLPELTGVFDSGAERSAAQGGADGSRSGPADGGLEGHVHSLLSRERDPSVESESAESGAGDFSTKAESDAPLHGSELSVPLCVREGIDRDEPPLAVGRAVVEGRQSYVVVLPHVSDTTRVDAYAVDAACVGKTPPAAGTVLTKGTYTRR